MDLRIESRVSHHAFQPIPLLLHFSIILSLRTRTPKLILLLSPFAVVNGSYDVIQSQFAAPCIPEAVFTPGANGFNSGLRPTNNGSAVTILNVTIADNSTAIWFYENSTCAEGGVGVINANDSSTETLAGFSVRLSLPILICPRVTYGLTRFIDDSATRSA